MRKVSDGYPSRCPRTKSRSRGGPEAVRNDCNVKFGRCGAAAAAFGKHVKIQRYPTYFDTLGVPEIEHVSYDLWHLRITARFPDHRPPVYVVFRSPDRFRVLDEGDLYEYWSSAGLPGGWILTVTQGGWQDQEHVRTGVPANPSFDEYVVVGTDCCVSVIARTGPEVRSAEPDWRE